MLSLQPQQRKSLVAEFFEKLAGDLLEREYRVKLAVAIVAIASVFNRDIGLEPTVAFIGYIAVAVAFVINRGLVKKGVEEANGAVQVAAVNRAQVVMLGDSGTKERSH
jgi:hypothetical protein